MRPCPEPFRNFHSKHLLPGTFPATFFGNFRRKPSAGAVPRTPHQPASEPSQESYSDLWPESQTKAAPKALHCLRPHSILLQKKWAKYCKTVFHHNLRSLSKIHKLHRARCFESCPSSSQKYKKCTQKIRPELEPNPWESNCLPETWWFFRRRAQQQKGWCLQWTPANSRVSRPHIGIVSSVHGYLLFAYMSDLQMNRWTSKKYSKLWSLQRPNDLSQPSCLRHTIATPVTHKRLVSWLNLDAKHVSSACQDSQIPSVAFFSDKERAECRHRSIVLRVENRNRKTK